MEQNPGDRVPHAIVFTGAAASQYQTAGLGRRIPGLQSPSGSVPVMTDTCSDLDYHFGGQVFCSDSVSDAFGFLQWGRPSLHVSLPFPRFANRAFAPSPVRSSSVVTQQYPSFPDSRASTACMNLDEFDSDCTRSMDITSPVSSAVMDKGCESSEESGDMNYPVSSGVVDQEGVSSVESGEVVPPDTPIMLSQI